MSLVESLKSSKIIWNAGQNDRVSRTMIVLTVLVPFDDPHEINILGQYSSNTLDKDLHCWMPWDCFVKLPIESLQRIMCNVNHYHTLVIINKLASCIDKVRKIPR